jgi:hypothetical protein
MKFAALLGLQSSWVVGVRRRMIPFSGRDGKRSRRSFRSKLLYILVQGSGTWFKIVLSLIVIIGSSEGVVGFVCWIEDSGELYLKTRQVIESLYSILDIYYVFEMTRM